MQTFFNVISMMALKDQMRSLVGWLFLREQQTNGKKKATVEDKQAG